MNARNGFTVTALAACVSVLVAGCGRDVNDAASSPSAAAEQTAARTTGTAGSVDTTTADTSPTANATYRGLRASAIIGKEVRNLQGTDVGKINDLIVDMNTGDVRYAVLEFDPGVFEGERLFAVPSNQLRMAADRDDLVYDMSRDRLERAGVNRSDWNQTSRGPNYLADLDKTWGVVQPTPGARAHRVSDLLGQSVNGRQGSKIGEIEEIVINMADQKVHYAVLEFDSSWSTPDKLYALPLTALKLNTAGDDVMLDVDRSSIQRMKAFPDARYTSLNDPAWVVDLDQHFSAAQPTLVASRAEPAAGTSARMNPPGQQATGSTDSDNRSPRAPRADRN